MAGNIIPAIATTNAITAGLSVMRTFNVLLEQFEKCKSVYVRLLPNPRKRIFIPDKGKFSYSFFFFTLIIFFFFLSFNKTKSQMYCVLTKTRDRFEN